MIDYIQEDFLIITKTYPIPSSNYSETTCVAAFIKSGEIRRLYPIPFRLLDGSKQFRKWEWIRVKVTRASSDHRPESYRVDVDSIETLRQVKTHHAWGERMQWITPHLLNSCSELETLRLEQGKSLGFIKPLNISLEITEADKSDWSDQEKENLVKQGLFDKTNIGKRNVLRKVPYDFRYKYECRTPNGIEKLSHKITDWEIGTFFWKCQKDYGNKWEQPFRDKLEREFSEEKDLIFLMGNMHRFQDQWLIVGLIYPPKVAARQEALWPTYPDG
ncbi:MAG TPA: hypothetical protein VKF38_17100 [Anaerolineaceae bacterium]|nr:hypothetical protein [Anaerolineaceae bacterium]